MNRNNCFTVRCNKNKPKCVITDYSKDTVKDDRKCKDCLSKEDIIRIIRRIVQNLPEGPPGPEGPEGPPGPQGPGGSDGKDGDSGEIEFVNDGDEINTDDYPDGSLFIITEVTENRVKKNRKNRPKSKDIVIISGNPYDVFQLDGNQLIEKGNIKGDSGESAEFIFINRGNAPDNLDGYDSNTLFIVTEQIPGDPDDPQNPFGGSEPYEMFTIQAGNLVEAGNIQGPQGPAGLSVVSTFEAWESMLNVVNNNTELKPPLTFLYTGDDQQTYEGPDVNNPIPGQVWQWNGDDGWEFVSGPNPASQLLITNFNASTIISSDTQIQISLPGESGINIYEGSTLNLSGQGEIKITIGGDTIEENWTAGSVKINAFSETPDNPEYPINITIQGKFVNNSSNTNIQWEITGEINNDQFIVYYTNQIGGFISNTDIPEGASFDEVTIESTIEEIGTLAKSKGIKSFRSKKTGHKDRKIGLFGKSRVLQNKSLSNVKYHVVHPHPDNGKERLSGNAHEDNEYSLSNEYDRQGNVLGVKVSSKYSNGLFPNARFILDVLPKGTDLENIEKLTLTLNSEHTEDLAGIAFHLYLNKYPQFGGNITPWVITPVKEELSAEGDVRYNLIDSKWRIVDQSETYTYSGIISNYKREDAVSKLFNLSSDMNYEVAHLNEIVIGAYGSSDNIKEGQVLNVLVKEISYKLFGKDERRIIPYIPGEEMFEGLKNNQRNKPVLQCSFEEGHDHYH